MSSKSTESHIIILISTAKSKWASSSVSNFNIHIIFNKVKFILVPAVNINVTSANKFFPDYAKSYLHNMDPQYFSWKYMCWCVCVWAHVHTLVCVCVLVCWCLVFSQPLFLSATVTFSSNCHLHSPNTVSFFFPKRKKKIGEKLWTLDPIRPCMSFGVEILVRLLGTKQWKRI